MRIGGVFHPGEPDFSSRVGTVYETLVIPLSEDVDSYFINELSGFTNDHHNIILLIALTHLVVLGPGMYHTSSRNKAVFEPGTWSFRTSIKCFKNALSMSFECHQLNTLLHPGWKSNHLDILYIELSF